MLETYYKMLNPTETIQKALPAVIEAFVIFYGEENREFIEQKFRDMLVIGYSSPSTVKSILLDMKKLKSKELVEKFFNEIGVEPNSEESKFYINAKELSNIYSIPIHEYFNFVSGTEMAPYKLQRAVEFLQHFYPDVTVENISELQAQGHFSKMEKAVKRYGSMLEEYQKFLETIKEYDDYVAETDKNLHDFESKYYLEFLEEFKDFIPLEELELIRKRKNDVKNSLYSTPVLSTLVGWNLNTRTLLDTFDEESEDTIKNNKQEWRVDSIKSDRIKFFKHHGIDHGDNYDDYRNDEECRKLIPSLDFIKKVKAKREELYTKQMNDYYMSTEDYKKNRQRITEAGCIVKEDHFNANAYDNKATFVSDNLVKRDGEYRLFALLCINMGTSAENLDANIIHELNHVIELHLKEVKGNTYSTTCGWDSFTDQIDKDVEEVVSLEDRKEKRDYELFSEIINELIAQEIVTILQNSGNYIFNPPGTGKIRGRTGYESTRYLVQDFFDEYHEDIVASRRKGNIARIKDSVGEKNFDALNDLFHDHNAAFQGFEIYRMYEDMQAKKDTPRTKMFHSLVDRKNATLKAMQEHHSQLLAQKAIV